MNDSPYTHPSMPGTSYRAFLETRPDYPASMPAIDLTVDVLSAALEDAEGPALVAAITDPANPRLQANRG